MIAVGRGVAEAGNKNCSPRPAATKEQLTQTVTAKGWAEDFALIAFLSGAFSLRVPSECLPLTGQRAGEDLLSEERWERKAAIWRAEKDLIMKLIKRKHMAVGSRIVRACICEGYAGESPELHVPRLFSPVCRLWPTREISFPQIGTRRKFSMGSAPSDDAKVGKVPGGLAPIPSEKGHPGRFWELEDHSRGCFAPANGTRRLPSSTWTSDVRIPRRTPRF